MVIHFEKATVTHLDTIFSWLTEPHVIEHWDNTQEHKEDIINFAEGRKTPSAYCEGKMVYWIALQDGQEFAMLMTEQLDSSVCFTKLNNLSKTGHTYGLDYMIGNPKFLGKGYGSQTLSDFIDYFRELVDSKADTFLIDPAVDNTRAKHIYEKAGFKHLCDFIMEGNVSGAGEMHHLLVKKFEPTISIIPATLSDYPVIQNMARFYVYDLSRDCGCISSDWAIPEDGLYECFDFKSYFEDSSRFAYLIEVYDELAGFVLLDNEVKDPRNSINMGEFFIIAKFQGQGIGALVAHKIWEMHPGKWEVSVIPENRSALIFWEKAIRKFIGDTFTKHVRVVDYDAHQPQRIIFEFDTQNKIKKGEWKILYHQGTIIDGGSI